VRLTHPSADRKTLRAFVLERLETLPVQWKQVIEKTLP
jgi:hypothetical protein